MRMNGVPPETWPIHVEDLTKVFYLAGGKRIEAVRQATFSVKAGEVFGLLGPNGAGKTTLLRMLGAIITPTSGRCWVQGARADETPETVRRQIGFLSGSTRLYGRLTAREVLRYFGLLYGMTSEAIRARTHFLAESLTMSDMLDQRCQTLSSGQTQKVSIARVLLHDPQVLILDEPTLGLDIMTCRTILDFILDAKHRGRTVVFSTHYMTEAELLCDRIALMHRGRILTLGTKNELYERTATTNLKDAFLALVAAEERAAP